MHLHDLFEKSTSRTTLCIFPGAFHVFHFGHKSVYNYLLKKFPHSDVYVASSNDTTKRPFSFEDKKFLATQAGIPSDKFVEVRDPYKSIEITKNYDPTTTVLIFALSEKDKGRLGNPYKKDGSPSYFQPFPGSIKACEPFGKHGYYVVVPTIKFSILGKPITSASQIREWYAKATDRGRLRLAKALYPDSHELSTVKELLDNVLASHPIKEGKIPKITNYPKSVKIEHDGWILPNGDFKEARWGGHINVLYKNGMDSYQEAYDKGWIHFYISNGEAILDVIDPKYVNSPKLEKIVKSSLSDFAVIKLNVWDESDDATEYIWNGKYFQNSNPRKWYIQESSKTHQQDGWILPNGKFVANQPNSGHFETLVKLGINSYEDAYEKGWIHLSAFPVMGKMFLEVGKTFKEMEKKVSKIASASSSMFPEIFLQVEDRPRNYEWTGKEFVVLSRPSWIIEGFEDDKSDYYYINSPKEVLQFKKSNGSKNSPITDSGWVYPNGIFISNGNRSHLQTGRKLGFDGYTSAFAAGLMRVSIYDSSLLIEGDTILTPTIEKMCISIIKRVEAGLGSVNVAVRADDRAGNYLRLEWDGRDLIRWKYDN